MEDQAAVAEEIAPGEVDVAVEESTGAVDPEGQKP